MVFHIIVMGTPKSVNSSPTSKNNWKNRVANSTREKFEAPLDDADLRVIITVFYIGIRTYDADNVSKPICDAMCGIAYGDDN